MSDIEEIIKEIYNDVKDINDDGTVADYIPQLGKVNPDLFGISVCKMNGDIINCGDTEFKFCLQSCSKPLSYCIAHNMHGRDNIHQCVGYEPSGQAFNAFILNNKGLPHNPMINAGAIMVASLLGRNMEPSLRFELVKDYYSKLCGHIDEIGFDNSVFLSEKHHADRNISLAYYMRENKAFIDNITPNEIDESLSLYFQCCSILINAKMGSIISATLANGGLCPITNEKVFKTNTIQDCLTLMYGCGMYDFSGQFAFEIGLPAKSGVSGCIFLVIPNVMGICIFSPKLDDLGNSVKGIEVCRRLMKKINYHIFHNIVQINNSESNELVLLQKLINYASENKLDEIKKLEGKIDFNKGDYDKRTAIHLAASEGHIDIVKYLLGKGVDKDVKDRWGNTPLSEAKNKDGENYEKIRKLLD
jgi:glutaminase